jgi:hypothetical protein
MSCDTHLTGEAPLPWWSRSSLRWVPLDSHAIPLVTPARSSPKPTAPIFTSALLIWAVRSFLVSPLPEDVDEARHQTYGKNDVKANSQRRLTNKKKKGHPGG